MLTIDIHTHILPENIPFWKEKFGYGGFVTLDHHKNCCAKMMLDTGKFFREIESNCWDPDQRIKECNHHRVDVQVLSTVPVMFSYWAKPLDALEISSFLNNHIADIVNRFPKRFIGLGTVPMQSTKLAIKELENCKGMGLKGVQIGSNVNQINLGDKSFSEFFAACEALEMAVFVHPWEMMGQENMQDYWLPWLVGMPAETSRAICSLLFSGTLEKYPNLKLAFAHGGGSFPSTLGRIGHGFDCRPDLVAKDNPVHPANYLGKFWFDSLVHDAKMLQYLVELAGPNRVALGSDYPFPLGENIPGELIKSMDWNDEHKNLLLHGAALEWLGLKKEFFLN